MDGILGRLPKGGLQGQLNMKTALFNLSGLDPDPDFLDPGPTVIANSAFLTAPFDSHTPVMLVFLDEIWLQTNLPAIAPRLLPHVSFHSKSPR